MANTSLSVIAVDWGTSHLRIWALDAHGKPVNMHHSSDGMRSVKDSAFASVLDKYISAMNIQTDIPVIMCGMVGSRQGWQEAPYVSIPCHIEEGISHAITIRDAQRDIRILPGFANRDAQCADVMRSEETQLLGLYDMSGDTLDQLVCMPGTHAKWVLTKTGKVIDFATSLSGELFAAISTASVLRYAIENAANTIDPQTEYFINGVRNSINEPATFLNRLFAVRSKSLLHDLSPNAAVAEISGSIIGQDIAGAMLRFSSFDEVILVGSGHLGALYSQALKLAGLTPRLVDGDELAVRGLTHAARTIWPDRFQIE